MSATLETLLPDALTLPDESKLLLAEQLLESISAQSEHDADLLAEVARRRAQAQADPSILLSGEKVLREVRAAVAAADRPS